MMLAAQSFAKRTLAHFSSGESLTKISLPSLPFAYDALEPVISKEILQVHHQGHHATYVKNLNVAMQKLQEFQAQENKLTEQIQAFQAIKFNGGGHINHSLVWENLQPYNGKEDSQASGTIASMIEKQFGSFTRMKEQFTALASAIEGSGYGWIGWCPKTRQIRLETTANQDILQTKGLIPLLAVDMWEHAYYLQYKNVKMDYLKGLWSIVNWDCVNERLEAAASESGQ